MGASPAAARRALEGHTLVKLDGAKLTLSELRGEVVVVNFWASWCRPCRRELPALDELHADIAKRGGRVLAVSIDHELDNARRFVRTHELGLPVVHDGPDGLARQLDLRAVPFTLVLDRSGEVAYTTTGADDKAVAELGAVVRGLLASTPQAARIPDPETSGGTR
jgi:peroxiredoxin